MPVLGKTVGYTIRGTRGALRGGRRVGGWLTRRVNLARHRGGAGELGMIRLLDLHAASCAGDTLVTMGLAGTVFFAVPAGEARGRVALYLLVTMAPFALLAPIVGPVLDRFRHGRRYALALTMLGRAFLAWLISDYIHGFGLYPAAFGVLVLSRAYGVARSAAVPRLLPDRLGLSEVGARASVFGAVAGAVVAPIGVAAFYLGPQWPLRVATVIFLVGMVIALRLPARADADPPETVPRLLTRGGRAAGPIRTIPVVGAVLTGSAALRALYGFLALFFAFAIRSGDLTTTLLGWHLRQTTALGLMAGSLAVGSLLATAVGTRLKIHRPVLLQAAGLALVTLVALVTLAHLSLSTVALLCLTTAIASGLAKLAVDATIQERVPERVRASAFAHSETLLMLAWVAGGALGLIPLGGRWGVLVATIGAGLAATRAVLLTGRLRTVRLTGAPNGDVPPVPEPTTTRVSARRTGTDRPGSPVRRPGWPRRSGAAATTARRPATDPARPDHVRTPAPDPDGAPTPARTVQLTSEDTPTYHLYRPSGTAPDPEEDP